MLVTGNITLKTGVLTAYIILTFFAIGIRGFIWFKVSSENGRKWFEDSSHRSSSLFNSNINLDQRFDRSSKSLSEVSDKSMEDFVMTCK